AARGRTDRWPAGRIRSARGWCDRRGPPRASIPVTPPRGGVAEDPGLDGPDSASVPGVTRVRAFTVESGPDTPGRDAIAAAHAEGWIPDVLLDGELIGTGPREALEPVPVTGA